MFSFRVVAYLVLSIISASIGTIIVIYGGTAITVISALGGFSEFNIVTAMFCMVFGIGLVQAVSACVASGFGCSDVCCNTNTTHPGVVIITQPPMAQKPMGFQNYNPSGEVIMQPPMTSVSQMASPAKEINSKKE